LLRNSQAPQAEPSNELFFGDLCFFLESGKANPRAQIDHGAATTEQPPPSSHHRAASSLTRVHLLERFIEFVP
jgi:hypothetical protein